MSSPSGPSGPSGPTEMPEPVPEPEPQPPGGKPPSHRWGFGAFLLVEAVLLATAALVSAVLADGLDPGEGVPMRNVLIGTIAPTLVAAGVAVLITVVRGNGPWVDLRLEFRWDDVRTGLRFGALGLLVTTIGVAVWTQIVGEENAKSAIGTLVQDKPMAVQAAIVIFLYLWLVGPICEEIIFRGLLWGAVERLHWGQERWGRLAAFVLSTAVFAASHLEPLRTTLLIVIAIPIGLARLVTGRLLGSIVAHQVNNFFPALALLLTATGVLTL